MEETNMRVSYNVTGPERKSLVAAISHELNAPTNYLGAPTFAYEVGGYHIDKTGTVTGEDNRELVADLCGLHSFKAVTEEYDEPKIEAEEIPAFEELKLTEHEELGLGKERRDPVGDNGMLSSDAPESCTYQADLSDRLTIEIPLDGFTPEKLDNLSKLVNAKAPLLKASLGTDDLPIKQTADTLQFPWFKGTMDAEHTEAYATLISLLCKTAIEKKRITAREKDIDGNPKYAMRCFLLSLGFIGDEYKAARNILLSRLEGNSSWKGGKKMEVSDSE
jgi:hypothetical protein